MQLQQSPAQIFAMLPENDRNSLLDSLSDEVKAALGWTWEGWLARPSQLEPTVDWLYWLVLAGRGFGKTRIGAEWVRRQVQKYPRVGLVGKDALDMRSVMIDGESGIMAVCPPHERPIFQPSKRQLLWPNGAISECRTGEDPEGVRGVQYHRVWADEIAAWRYSQETWDMVLLALRLGDDPRALVTTTPKPIQIVRELVNDPDCVLTGGSTHENLANLGPTYRTIIGRYEGTRLGQQELYAQLLEDEGLAYRYSERIHVVPRFSIPNHWDRFEHMDYGLSAPTAWYVQAIDPDGNQIICDGLYEPGLPSEIGPKIKARRDTLWGTGNLTFADPAVFHPGARTKMGVPASVADEFSRDCDIPLIPANNDRRAGFVRVSELLRANPDRLFPAWHPLIGEPGAPQLFIMDTPGTLQLREQLQDAPLEEDGKPLPGEAVDRDWERSRGHAHASLRYGVMARPGASTGLPPEEPDDPRAAGLQRLIAEETEREADELDELGVQVF